MIHKMCIRPSVSNEPNLLSSARVVAERLVILDSLFHFNMRPHWIVLYGWKIFKCPHEISFSSFRTTSLQAFTQYFHNRIQIKNGQNEKINSKFNTKVKSRQKKIKLGHMQLKFGQNMLKWRSMSSLQRYQTVVRLPKWFHWRILSGKNSFKIYIFIWCFSDLMNYKNIIEWTLRKDKEASKSTSRLYIHLLFGWVTLKSSIQ